MSDRALNRFPAASKPRFAGFIILVQTMSINKAHASNPHKAKNSYVGIDGVQHRDRSLHRQDQPSRLDQKLGLKDTLDRNLLTFNARYTLRQRT
jgi:hypothetical protein